MATLPAIHAMDEAPGVVASVERIDAWMETAKPGDRFLYATRSCLPIASKGAARMRDLAGRGLVLLTRPRCTLDPTLFSYQAHRTAKPTALARPMRPVLALASVSVCDGEARIIDALLPVLERFARHGRPCPTDKQLAAKARITEDEVKAGLEAMVAAHLIRVHGCAAPTYRRIAIVASGLLTGIAA